jgi:hypothetical protein
MENAHTCLKDNLSSEFECIEMQPICRKLYPLADNIYTELPEGRQDEL